MLWPIIRSLPAHVLPPLATTYQLRPVSRKAERNAILLIGKHHKMPFRAGLPGKPARANTMNTASIDYNWPTAEA